MKKKIIKIVLLSFISLCFFSKAYADTGIHLKISTPSSTIYDKDIIVTPCNSDNNATTNLVATPYCAILQSGLQNNWTWYSFGALLNSLDNISSSTTKDSQGNDVYNFWDWFLNGTEATMGLSEYTLKQDDLISLKFVDPGNTITSAPSGGGPLLTYTAPAAVTNTSSPSAVVVPAVVTPPTHTPAILAKHSFDVKKAFDFLVAEQKSDGSFGEDLYTDWTAIALASGNYSNQTIKLNKYFEESKIESQNLTDYERHAMALMALGLNPYDTNGENYIEKIIAGFDGKQFGDTNQDNDDIFALIVLQNAGYSEADNMMADDISFVLSAQNTDGSWDGSIDMTGAAMETLAAFNQNINVKEALEKAENFLKQHQKDDGGWNDNASSSAWALEGILTMNEEPENWIKNNNTPFDYLSAVQDTDGGVKDESMNNKIWETAYVVSALSGKTWNQIMQNFEKPATPVVSETIPVPTPAPTTTTPEKKDNTVVVKKNTSQIAEVSSLEKTKTANTIKNKTSYTATQNTASVIDTVTPITTPTQIQAPKKNWFRRLLDNIFGSF